MAAEDEMGRPAELDRDLTGSLGEPLAGTQVERYRCPPPVVDQELQRHVRLGARVGCHAFLLAVRDDWPTLDETRSILGAYRRVVDPAEIERMDRGEHLVFLVVDRRGVECHRWLHCEQAE